MKNAKHVTLSYSLIALTALMAASGLANMVGCDTKSEPAVKPGTNAAQQAAQSAGQTAAKPDGKPSGMSDGHGSGPAVQLGEQVISGMTIKAARDGDVAAGGDVPVDVWVTSATAKVTAVRMWIGTEDGKGSLKAKAALEKDSWHNHVEVPKELSAASKLWVEVETEKGEKTVAGFELKK